MQPLRGSSLYKIKGEILMKFFTKNLILMFVIACLINSAVFAYGKLQVYRGPMWGGKTTGLLKQLNAAEREEKKVLTLKHYWDKHEFDGKPVVSARPALNQHDGLMRIATKIGEKIPNKPENSDVFDLEQIPKMAENYDVIGIDEVQFFTFRIVEIIRGLVSSGKQVICAGLDFDFLKNGFGKAMPALILEADEVFLCKAICECCGKPARFTQRLVNGRPARHNDPLILIGDNKECYEPRCESCHEIDWANDDDFIVVE